MDYVEYGEIEKCGICISNIEQPVCPPYPVLGSSEEEENKPFMDGCNSVMLKVGWYQEGG